MPDYAKMYYTLFNPETESIEILQRAQQDTEEMYISAKEPEIHLLHAENQKEDGDEE